MWRNVFPELCSVLTQELHAKLTIYKRVVSWHKCVRSSYQELRTNSTWAGVGLTQARSAINILQAHLQLYNFTVSTGSTWEGCKTNPQKAWTGSMQGLHCVCWVHRGSGRSSPLVHTDPHTSTYRQFCKQPPNRDPKYISSVCSSNWQLNYSFLNPSASGELGHSLNLQWERTGGFCWRHEEFDQDLPWFLRLVLKNI